MHHAILSQWLNLHASIEVFFKVLQRKKYMHLEECKNELNVCEFLAHQGTRQISLRGEWKRETAVAPSLTCLF